MKKVIISMCLFVCFVLHATAKESESDIFLKELAAALNQNSSETGVQAKYEKRCFYVVSQEDIDIPPHITKEKMRLSGWDLLNDDDVFRSMVFDLDRDHPGLIKHLLLRKAKLSWTYNIPRLELARTVVFGKDEVRQMMGTSPEQRKKLKEQVMIKSMNCMLPIAVDEGVTLQNIKLTPQSFIFNINVDEDAKRLEELANDNFAVTANVLLSFCKDKESDFHKALVEDELNIIVRFTGMPSHRYFDTEIPASLIKEVVTNDQIKDEISLSVYLGIEQLKKKLPMRLNEQRTMTNAWVSLDDNTGHYVIKENKNGVDQLLLLADQPDIQRWLIGYGMLVRPEDTIKDIADAGFSYEYIVKGEGIKDSLSFKFDNALLKQMTNVTQWQRDSIEVALNVALWDASLKQQPKEGIIYTNSFKVEGQNVVKEYIVKKGTDFNNIKRYPMTLKRGELEQSGSQAQLLSILKKCKRNLVLRFKNKQNTKQWFDVPISYFEIE